MTISNEIDRLKKAGLLRRTHLLTPADRPGWVIYQGRRLMDLCSNDYLNLSRHPDLIDASCRASHTEGCSARASRLMSGTLKAHERLETAVAQLKNSEAALVIGSGYLANTGIIPALCSRHDAIFSDRLNHASIMDGIQLSRARLFRYRHRDPGHLRQLLETHRQDYQNALIISESIFSMDGDMADIPELIRLKRQYSAMLLIDDAHATGIFGKHGEGAVERGVAKEVDVITGTFGKALGSYGAYAAVSQEMKELLVNRCRTFIFSTALPPSVIEASLAAIGIVSRDNRQRQYLLNMSDQFRQLLREETGISTQSISQIIPITVGSNRAALELQKLLMDAGFFTKAIRPPTVPQNSARIRISLTTAHHMDDLRKLVSVTKEFIIKNGGHQAA